MIKKLRRKFLSLAMLSFALVLVVVSATIHFSMVVRGTNNADYLLQLLAQGEGEFPVPERYDDRNRMVWRYRLTEDTPFELRYYVVETGAQGEIRGVDVESTALVSVERAEDYARQILAEKEESGYLDKYRFLVQETTEGYRIIGLDCIRQMDAIAAFDKNAVIVTVSSLVIVFLLLLFSSRRLMAPIIQNLENQKQFITDAGHEIKTPLAIISANNEIVKLNYGESRWTESTDNQVDRLNLLVEQLLLLSRMEENRQQETAILLNFSQLIRDTVENVLPLFETAGISLLLETEPDFYIETYDDSLQTLVEALVENMIQYTPEGGKAAIRVQQKRGRVLFENTLDSPLMEQPDRLFERFYRRESSRSRETGGNGIGLSVARAIARAHGGELSASTRGGSLLFTLQLE